jgi:hypothetical protein
VELVLLTDYRGALRQKQQIWESLDVEHLRRLLADNGIRTEVMHYERVANGRELPSQKIIHYTSTQDTGYHGFVDDVLYFLHLHNRLVPRYEFFRAHENKGFQELLKKEMGMAGLPGRYLGNEKGLSHLAGDFQYPQVFKPASGFMSKAVSLVESESDLRRTVRRSFRPAGLWSYRLKHLLKRLVLKKRFFPEMYEDCVHSGRYVLQDFLPGAGNDWKVLVYGDHYFVMRRAVRPGDFRASGSGRFTFDAPPDPVLDFARKVFRKLDVPMASLDIIVHEDQCHLIEFQALHFGTVTMDCSPHRYEHGPEGWKQVTATPVLEEEYAHGLVHHLRGS